MNPETVQSLPPILKRLALENFLLITAVVIAARIAAAGITAGLGRVAKKSPLRWRVRVLAAMLIARFSVVLATTAFIVSLLVVPSWQNVVGLVAGAGLMLSFALKDYGSCLLAGVATIFERTYQPGDWIEIGGAYGEVRSVGLRAVHLVTLDDTEVIVPHSAIWASPVFNATSGSHTVLCGIRSTLLGPGPAAPIAAQSGYSDRPVVRENARRRPMNTSSGYRSVLNAGEGATSHSPGYSSWIKAASLAAWTEAALVPSAVVNNRLVKAALVV